MTKKYDSIDGVIKDWVEKHFLKLNEKFGGEDRRYVYCSSKMGECFQIWIEPSSDDNVSIGAACIEGRREDDPSQQWTTPSDGLGAALERAYQTVVEWMAPSERYFPKK